MKIAPYWIREVREIGGLQYRLRAFSFRSPEEARERLETKVQALRAFHRSRGGAEDVATLRRELRGLDEREEGEYEVVMTEPIVRRVDACNVITRNRYGAEVLNSEDTCFLDVDCFGVGLLERVKAFFGAGRSAEELLLREVRRLCAEDSSLGVRVYRTGRGWRLLVAGEGVSSPTSPRLVELCRRLQVDDMYAALCRKQLCWRARLTPKPSRLGLPRFPRPMDSESLPPEVAEWLATYEQRAGRVCVCRLVDVLGARVDTPIVHLHDEATGALQPDADLR